MSDTLDLFTRSEHAELMQKLNAWDIAYHQNDAPIVDDATYDAAKKRALELEEKFPELAKNGASTHVGAAVSTKVPLFFPASTKMLLLKAPLKKSRMLSRVLKTVL